MFSLEDLLGQEQGSQAVEQISRNLGANSSVVNSAIQLALPAILSGLAKNAATPQGAQSLDNALSQDHAGGGLLDNLMGYLGGGIPATQDTTRETNGGGILGHIFGGNQTQVANEVSQQSGLNMGQVASLLITLAPIVMSYLGKQKQTQGLDADGLSNYLGGQQEKIQQSPQSGLINSILDRNHDGSAMDDLASMAFNYMTTRK